MFGTNEVIVPALEDYDRSGLVRATAERLGLPLVTGNTAHFHAMVDAGLRIDLENWREP